MLHYNICCSSRLESLPCSGRDAFIALPDGRRECFECCLTAVVDSAEASELYVEVVDFMERQLGLVIPPEMRDVPVLAVDLGSLNEQREKTPSGHGHGVVRGLTLYSYATVSHITPGQWSLGGYLPDSRAIFRTECLREVTAVLVLVGMPRDVTASVLAHEAMHVYLKLSKSFPLHLSSQCEEGLCQLVAMRLLSTYLEKRRTSSDSQDDFRRSLLRYSLHCIESDTSVDYGEGFRKAHRCLNALGLHVLLEHVAHTGDLPVV